MSTGPTFPVRPANFICSARPGINVLCITKFVQLFKFYINFLEEWRKGHKPLKKILLSKGIICNFIVYNRRRFKSSKQENVFRILVYLKINLKNYIKSAKF